MRNGFWGGLALAGLVGAGLTVGATRASQGTGSVAAPGAKLMKLAGDFLFTEGPASDAKGNVYFTDQPNDRILEWSVDGKLSTFMSPAGRSNGLTFDKDGNLWACADEKNQLWKIAMGTKKVEVVLLNEPGGKLFNGPNDIWMRPKGAGIYFTDPLYPRPYWKRDPAMQPRGQYVYFMKSASDRASLHAVVTDLVQPNGIIGTPDGKTLYVADLKDSKTYAFDIQMDGSLKNKRLFYPLGSDGMTIDDAGNIYLTGKDGVTVVNKAGKLVQTIPVAEDWTANVCFGGKDRHTLFITASKGLYSIRTKTRGVDSQ